jgi:opacity protein-like surface antigen
MAKFLRSIGMMVMAGALLSGTARAADEGSGDGAWGTQYGMLFRVENVLSNNKSNTFDSLAGGVGLQYNLSPQRAIRFEVGLSRASDSATEQKRTDLVTGTTTTTFALPDSGFTSRYDVDVGAAYMMRLTSAALAPYLGAGAGIGYFQESEKWKDDTAATEIDERDHLDRTIGLNAQGILGLEWRVHKSVALFAEYALDVGLISYNSRKYEDTTTLKADGSMTNGTRIKRSSTTFLNFDTGIGQGGLIGLMAFF